MTPNTSSIMGGVEPGRRGIVNGVRSMLQNTGYAVSTAMSLAIVTSPLTAGEKQAAYAGTLSRLSSQALDNFTGGYRTALAVLAGICVLGMALSLARNAGPRRAIAPDAVRPIRYAANRTIIIGQPRGEPCR